MNKCSLLRRQGIMLAEVVHRVLEEHDLTQKVRNIYLFFQS